MTDRIVLDLTGTTPDALPSAMTIPDFYNLCERQLLSMGTTQFLGVIAQVLDQHRDYELDTQSTHKPGAAAVPSFEEFAWDHNAKSPSPPAMSGGPLSEDGRNDVHSEHDSDVGEAIVLQSTDVENPVRVLGFCTIGINVFAFN
jgi:hypothetical protein